MATLRELTQALLLFSLVAGRAEDWPRFRGPNGSGISVSSSIPVVFGPDKNLSWRVAVPPGHSSPVICGRQLYLTSFDNDTLRTHAFDTQTGKTVWLRELKRTRHAKHHSLSNAASPLRPAIPKAS